MKISLLHTLCTFTRYIWLGLVVQYLCMSTLGAVPLDDGQHYISARKVFIKFQLPQAQLKTIFQYIEEHTKFKFSYHPKDLQAKPTLSMDTGERSVADILTEVSGKARLKFKQINNIISVDKLKNASSVPFEVLNQDVNVTGKVLDENEDPLPGATIQVRGTTRGVITDVDGSYVIKAKPGDVLICSFVGMETQIIEVGNQREIVIKLLPKAESLEEVEVVAFATQKKESVIASITTVKPGDLKVPSSNLTTALAGRMSGIISYQRSGEPGQDNAQFFIRGVTTFGYKKDPLILIDGVELTSEDLARMQPDDIASFSIMKDATATALYGARGANGVILVTTKEGVEGKAKVSIRFENSISSPTKEIQLADPVTYMKLHNESVRTRNPLNKLPYMENKIAQTEAGGDPFLYPATNWHKELFKEYTVNQRLNFNISGGGKVARYYLAATYNKDNGILNVDKRNNFNSNINLKKYLIRSNINLTLTKSTEAVIRMHGTFDDYTGPIDGGSAMYKKVMKANPVLFPAYYPADEAHQFTRHILFGNHAEGSLPYINPYAEMVKGYKDYSKTLLLTQVELKQKLDFITKGLSIRTLGNINRYSYFDVSRNYNPYYYQIGYYNRDKDTYTLSAINPETGTEYLEYSEGDKHITSTMYWETALQYNREFNEAHGVSGLLVYIMREQLKGNAGDLQKSLPYRNLGLSGRFTYAYKGRYFTEFNFGFNGSERFSKENRFGFFPSMGLGWYVSNEPFWEGISKVVHKLKFKATYGLVGNDAIGNENDRFFYLSNVNLKNEDRTVSFGKNFIYGKPGVSISRYANSNITWETAKKLNIGIELGLFENFEVQVDLFREDRENILMNRVSLASMGLQAPVRANVGEAYSEGVDFSVDYQKFFSNELWLTVRGNFTYATGKFKKYEEPNYESTPWLSRKDYSISQTWGYIAERLFIDEAEVRNSPEQTFGDYTAGDIKYRDINGDGKITTLDRVPLGYPTSPEIVYGFGFSAGYKKFDISCFFQGLARESFWIDAVKTAPFIHYDDPYESYDDSYALNNALLEVYAQNHWSEANPDQYALWPRLDSRFNANNSQTSTWFMQNGAFLRLKSLEVGYSLASKGWVERIGMEQFRLYASGVNLLTFSKFKLWDPEMGGNGLGYPIQRVINLGLQISF
ncbi:TonB-dependent receptor [Rapidithrix thailandica]|uniref:TonB-dependent receptor n=1 Tax=Rapidithrix thailandica TaxID=413964 RepID=A0AAW9S7D1_9BACT